MVYLVVNHISPQTCQIRLRKLYQIASDSNLSEPIDSSRYDPTTTSYSHKKRFLQTPHASLPTPSFPSDPLPISVLTHILAVAHHLERSPYMRVQCVWMTPCDKQRPATSSALRASGTMCDRIRYSASTRGWIGATDSIHKRAARGYRFAALCARSAARVPSTASWAYPYPQVLWQEQLCARHGDDPNVSAEVKNTTLSKFRASCVPRDAMHTQSYSPHTSPRTRRRAYGLAPVTYTMSVCYVSVNDASKVLFHRLGLNAVDHALVREADPVLSQVKV
ncbi:hypothetical protein HYPSUDRAFT_618385 [Hypholoma sublateritium FD-334 SS-4]|uniref:Uncharacterized protein n=1 Tax=Hypholoma sublateritium (strain FD-334 SS-4) TaxID=945553 RepID=A0A0D2MXG5_HYPSF|nr:hypothetical protein HYPSUDRAFT_618385 [Hypholoma sublateritium FD-334 SS-4]